MVQENICVLMYTTRSFSLNELKNFHIRRVRYPIYYRIFISETAIPRVLVSFMRQVDFQQIFYRKIKPQSLYHNTLLGQLAPYLPVGLATLASMR